MPNKVVVGTQTGPMHNYVPDLEKVSKKGQASHHFSCFSFVPGLGKDKERLKILESAVFYQV